MKQEQNLRRVEESQGKLKLLPPRRSRQQQRRWVPSNKSFI